MRHVQTLRGAGKKKNAIMTRRYNDLLTLGVRNIVAYNEKLKEFDRSKHPDLAHLELMPYLVIVVFGLY
jgi:DNA segregation ATPase FtsK/SpoIIIE and related proteins